MGKSFSETFNTFQKYAALTLLCKSVPTSFGSSIAFHNCIHFLGILSIVDCFAKMAVCYYRTAPVRPSLRAVKRRVLFEDAILTAAAMNLAQ